MSGVRIAVVGHCASGKTTIVALLKRRGYDAYSVAQEHSIVRDLWAHLEPDHVLFLDVSLDGIRRRKRNPRWPEWIYNEQERRLLNARENAAMVVDTDAHGVEEVIALVDAFFTQE